MVTAITQKRKSISVEPSDFVKKVSQLCAAIIAITITMAIVSIVLIGVAAWYKHVF